MVHADHVNFLRDGVRANGGTWADVGSGTGAFTLALAELIGPAGIIYSIDKDRGALAQQERLMRERFPNLTAHYLAADFTRPIQIPPLDGIVMANALHFHRDKENVVRLLRSHLKPGGRMIIVEYNIASGNFAVPHPIPFRDWQTLARRSGFAATKLLATRPSRFLKEIYSAVSW